MYGRPGNVLEGTGEGEHSDVGDTSSGSDAKGDIVTKKGVEVS